MQIPRVSPLLRRDYRHMLIFVNGMAESIAKSGSDGFTPLSTRFTPSMATIAPL